MAYKKKEKRVATHTIKFQTRGDIQPVIDEFFEEWKAGKIVLTVQALALKLGLNSTDDLKVLCRRGYLKAAITRALLMIENEYVAILSDPSIKQTKGITYLLNNIFKDAGYADKHELNLTGNVNNKIIMMPHKVKAGSDIPQVASKRATKKKKL